MKTTLIPKALRKQAALRTLKTPDILAQQAALNGVLLGRKSGVHQADNKVEKLARIRLKESQKLL